MEQPQFDNWKDAWEYHAGQQHDAYRQFTAAELLKELRTKGPDPYYSIWYALKEKGDTETGLALIKELKKYNGKDQFLLRYHCVETIFQLLSLRGNALKTLLTGPSTSFSEDYFLLGLSELKRVAEKYEPK